MVENVPYGLQLTHRLVVPDAEKKLFDPALIYKDNHSITLVDYMGGDAMVERVATGGMGVHAFKEQPSQKEFLAHLPTKGIITPFKSVQFKFQIQSSIADALHMVYDTRCSVNEYSGRYSVMIDSGFIPTAEYLYARLQGKSVQQATDASKAAAELFAESRSFTYDKYKILIDEKGFDLARELARTPLDVNNDTRFFWKIDLVSLLDFIKEKRKLLGSTNTLSPFLDEFEYLAHQVAPLSVNALTQQGSTLNLTYPTDEEIVEGYPRASSFGVHETKRITAHLLEEIVFQPIPYLEHGALQAVDYMGDDGSIAEGARTSYGQGTKKVSEDKALVKYLLRHRHTSPFELVELAFEAKTPLFVDPRQMGRHRMLDFHGFMGENVLGSSYFVPADKELKMQSRDNRQGRGDELSSDEKREVLRHMHEMYEAKLRTIHVLDELGVDEQTKRHSKGVGFYNINYRTGDLNNLFRMLALRLDGHAQKEIREEAIIIADFVKRLAPTAYGAFEDYIFNAVTFSASELTLLSKVMKQGSQSINDPALYAPLGWVSKSGQINREAQEFISKFKKMNAEDF